MTELSLVRSVEEKQNYQVADLMAKTHHMLCVYGAERKESSFLYHQNMRVMTELLKHGTEGTVMGMAELCTSLHDALEYIRGQIDSGYIDLGIHDELEIRIIDNALCVWEERMKAGDGNARD